MRNRHSKVKPWINNEVRSDNFWTGKISKNTLTDEMIWFINLISTKTGVLTLIQVLRACTFI